MSNALKFERFDSSSFLENVRTPQSIAYMKSYLSDLGAKTVVVEKHYFDQDHLDAVSGYYSLCARGYPNVCTRLHIFKCEVSRADVIAAASGHEDREDGRRLLQDNYLGFIIVRPLVPPIVGRTVLVEYPNEIRQGMGPRESKCAREYQVHLAGIQLQVRGLAWQQQDRAVSSCAIVALWSMFHSLDNDESRNIPTTTDIARRVHGLSWRSRVQPTPGLNNSEVAQIIRAFDLTPFVVEGDAREITGQRSAFSLLRFSGICACLLRSGFPILMACTRQRREGKKTMMSGRHAICATGFRVGIQHSESPFSFGDKALTYLYAHDDNWGPNARFRVDFTEIKKSEHVMLVLDPPPARGGAEKNDAARSLAKHADVLIPTTLFVGVPPRMRVNPDALYAAGIRVLGQFGKVVAALSPQDKVDLSTMYLGNREYMRDELPRMTAKLPGGDLAHIRFALVERVAPLSLYLGVIRFGIRSSMGLTPLFDILYDTTEGERAMRAMATVAFSTQILNLLTAVKKGEIGLELGELVGPT